MLSNLLWSAYGINRPATADRTAPSWRHAIESEIYVAMADGVWRYDPRRHRLVQVVADDVRAQTGVQDFVGTAPLNLVYVADGDRLEGAAGDDKRFWASTDTGFIGQNVYLFCASEGLATVFRASFDRARLAQDAEAAADEVHHLRADGRLSESLTAAGFSLCVGSVRGGPKRWTLSTLRYHGVGWTKSTAFSRRFTQD